MAIIYSFVGAARLYKSKIVERKKIVLCKVRVNCAICDWYKYFEIKKKEKNTRRILGEYYSYKTEILILILTSRKEFRRGRESGRRIERVAEVERAGTDMKRNWNKNRWGREGKSGEEARKCKEKRKERR